MAHDGRLVRTGGPHVWWRVRDYACAAAWIVAGLAPPWGADELARPPVQGRPVVLVPGVYEAWHFLRPLGRELHDRGLQVHAVPALRRNHRPVPEGADVLRRAIAGRDLHDVVLLAHSKGGLVGKHAMLADLTSGERRIASMITVNTPFGGSRHARWVPLRAVRALVPGDTVIQALVLDRSVDARILAVRSVWDPHVPEAGAPQGVLEVVLPTPGHFRVLEDPALADLVVRHVLGER